MDRALDGLRPGQLHRHSRHRVCAVTCPPACLFCLRHQYPMNMALLSAWTFAMAMSVATSCIYGMCDPMVIPADGGGPLPFSIANNAKVLLYGGAFHCAVGTQRADDGANAVIMAAMITATIFFSLTAFTMQSKIDFSFLGAGLFACTVILMLFGIGMAIFGASANLYYGYCVDGAIIFSLYIIFDTYMIHNRLGPDDYIIAAIELYLDIINLFIFILQLLNRRD